MKDLLSQPLRLPCGATLRNRLAKAPLTEGLADTHNRASERLVRLYRRWAAGGAALLVTGNVQCDRRFLERPGNVAIDHNDGIEQLKAYAAAGTCAGNHLWMQINHPGRQAGFTFGLTPLAPSAVALNMPGKPSEPPRAMTEEEILDVVRRFAHVARVARDTGFTGVQIHSAHGYLLSQFLSPISNRRVDAWGGSLENRARALLETVRAVRKSVGADFPVAVKLNSADFQKGGFDNDECLQVVRWLGQEKIDLLEISGGNYEQVSMLGLGEGTSHSPGARESTRQREGYFLDYAKRIRPVATMPLMITGGMRSRAAMVDALAAGGLDVIGIGRPLCVDPELCHKLLKGEVEAGTSFERQLKLDPAALGADADPAAAHLIEVFGNLGWFCLQLIRMGDGKDPDTGMGVLDAFKAYQANETATAEALQAG